MFKFHLKQIAIIFLTLTLCGGWSDFSSVQAQTPKLDEKLETEIVKGSNTEINVKNADIEALIRIFSKKTKRNYILDERVKGTVSIYLPGKVSSEEAIYILDSVLALKGFTSVPIGDNIWKIIPATEAKQTTIPVVEGGTGRGTASVVTRFINLKFVSAENVKELVSSLISTYGLVSAYPATNSLILIDSEDNINRLVEIIERMDLPATDSEMIIIPVKHADASDLAEKISQILNIDSKEAQSGAGLALPISNRQATRLAGSDQEQASPPRAGNITVNSRAKDPKIIGDERTNSIIVVADNETAARIQALVDQLDSPVDLSGDGFYVYRCQYASATDLADVLSGLAGGGNSGSSSSRTNSGSNSNSNSQGGFGSNSNRSGNNQNSNNGSQSRFSGGFGQSGSNSGSNSGTSSSEPRTATSVNLGENLTITADPATNSLIIIGSRTDYEKIKKLLKNLDVKRRQVVVEALILEVGVDESKSLGVEFTGSGGGADGGVFGSNSYGNLATLLENPTQLQDFTLAAASSGTLTLPGGITIPTQSVLVRAAQNNSNVNVLSSPTIIATDNEDAEIIVGSNVPFISSTASNQTDLNNVFNQVDRQDVGITLRITPQISSSDYVKLKLFTEVSNVVSGTEGSALGPTTTVRTSDTTVIAKDSQMVVIGGLMSDNITEAVRGIPFLKDMPLLGFLFRTNSDRNLKTNLLIFITPRIIKDQFDARDHTIEQRDSFQEVIEKYKINPTRNEVLFDESIDNVIDGQLYEGTKPSTIRPQDKPIAPVAPKTNSSELSFDEADRIEPKFKDTAATTKGSYFVLELSDGLPEGVWPDLFSRNTGELIGIRLPQEVSSYAKKFFDSGQKLSYSFNGQSVPLEVIGAFKSLNEAEEYYPNLKSNWYSLPPQEILNLGQGPWVKE